MIIYKELTQTAAENFLHYVESKSNRTAFSESVDEFGRMHEATVFYRGSRITGKQVRDPLYGYRYFLRVC